MELFITKKFLDDFYSSFDEENIYHVDFKFFLEKKIRGVIIITDFKDEAEWENASKENPLWEKILDSGFTEVEYVPTVSSDIHNLPFYSNYTYPYKLFLINEDKSTCATLSNDFGFEYICSENLESRWKIYYSGREDYHLPIDLDSEPRFKSWSKLSDFGHPINTIVIFDNYLFSEFKPDGTKEFSYKNNLLEMLENLLNDIDNKLELQILIITDKRNINIDEPNQPLYPKDRMNFVLMEIEEFLRSKFPNLFFCISLVNYDKRIYPDLAEHDRGVYTNYFYFEIGIGINVFDCFNNVTRRSKISFFAPIKSNERNIALSGLINFKKYINKLEDHLVTRPRQRSQHICGGTINRLTQ